MLHGQVKFKFNQAIYILSGNTSFHVNFFFFFFLAVGVGAEEDS